MSARPVVDVAVDESSRTVSGRTLKHLPTLSVPSAAKPLYAYVGALDLALEQAQSVPAQVRTIPAQVKGLRGDVASRVEEVTDRATEVYMQLSVRGERLVTAIRRQPAADAAVVEGKEAVRRAEQAAQASATAARTAVKAVEGAAQERG